MDASKCEVIIVLLIELCTYTLCNKLICVQLGLLTYYSGLLTIEIALTHAAVYKVSILCS